MVRKAPARGGRQGHEHGVSPLIGTMFVFVIIVMGMSGALVFGVPSIQGIQDRAALGDMAGQLERVREEAEKLTVEGAGSGVALAPSDGHVSLQEGTKMAVTISFDSTSQQQGLSLAWGKGGKKKSQVSTDAKQCDVHLQDWADGDRYVTMVMDKSLCQEPVLWDPADGGSSTSGGTTTQTLGVSSVVASAEWTQSSSLVGTSDNQYATYATADPASGSRLRVVMTDPISSTQTISSVVIWAEVSVQDDSDDNPNDGFVVGFCLDEGVTCVTENGGADGKQESPDALIDFDASNDKPDGTAWTWADIAELDATVTPSQTGGKDGTWRVDRVWVVVTSEAIVVAPSADDCWNDPHKDYACLQGYKMTDSGAVNRVIDIDETATDPQGEETYLLTLDAPLEGDWYFQLSNDPRTASSDTLLAKSFIFEMDQLRWVRDQGLATWLEGGAVFGTRLDTQYVIDDPIVNEDFIEADAAKCDEASELDDPACQPTYYLRVIRFDAQEASVSANGGAIDVYLEHVSTSSTANDGVSIIRFDFAGEGAQLWCNAFQAREAPAGYDYVVHADYPCDGSAGNDVRSLAYVYDPSCPAVAPNGYTWDPGLSEEQRDKETGCIQYKRDLRRYYSVVFAEVHFDVKLRP